MRTNVSLIFIGLLLLVSTCVTDDGDTYKKYFIKYYGLDGDHEAADMVVNADGTIVLIGTTEFPASSGSTKVYVVKTNAAGQVLWEKTFGNGTDFAQDIEPIPNGYVILSNMNVGVDQHNFMLIRIDNNGNKLGDSLVYDLLTDQFGQSVTPLSDGGFYVVGNTLDSDSLNTGDAGLPVNEKEDLLYVRFNTFSKFDSSQDRKGGSTLGSVVKVFETAPGVFMNAEYSNHLTDGEAVAALNFERNFVFNAFRADPRIAAGSILYAGDGVREEYMNQTVSSPEGSFYSIGTSIGLANSSTVFITKTRMVSDGSNLNVLKSFENSFGNFAEGVSIFPSGAACYVVGNIVSESDGTRDIWLTKVNSFTGDQYPAWTSGFTFGTPTNDDTGKVVAEAPNGDIIILGTMNLTNQKKIALIKVNKVGKFLD